MGRYSIAKRRRDVEREIAAKLRVRLTSKEGYERFNVAPTQEVPAVVQNSEGRAERLLRWGLVPRWAKRLNTRLTMINARAESLATSSTYGGLLARGSHRCLVMADGFYEWIASEDPRQPRLPMHFSLAGGGAFCFAGLWTTWTAPDGLPLASCAVVTTRANELVAPVHDRMPALLDDRAAWEAWLDPALDGAAVAPLLAPLPADRMAVAPANPVVNSADHEGPDCLSPPTPA